MLRAVVNRYAHDSEYTNDFKRTVACLRKCWSCVAAVNPIPAGAGRSCGFCMAKETPAKPTSSKVKCDAEAYFCSARVQWT